jgi:hypothetical protein
MRRVAAGNPLDQWMTPEWAAALLVERYFGGLGPRDRVLEPAAGRGAFLKAIPEQADAVGVEIDPALAAAAEADTGRRVITGDFRTVRLPWDPTAIVGNPPFDVRLLEALLRRAEGWLPDDGLCGLLLPAYALQNHRRVVRWAETWGLASDMVPRGLFPDLRLPLVFVRFRKGRIRTMLGFALYREAAEVDRLSAASRLALVAGAPRRGVWRALVEEALGRLGGEAPLEAIYEAVEPRRPTPNAFWREKVRQQLQLWCERAAPGVWRLRTTAAGAPR